MSEIVPAPAGSATDDGASVRGFIYAWLTGLPSPHTREAYARDIGVHMPSASGPGRRPHASGALPWLDFCRAGGLDPLGARREHVALWLRHLEAAGLAPATRERKAAAVSSWYRWLTDEGHIAANPAARVARPFVNRDASTTPGITRDQATAMLAAADTATGAQALRNRALLAVLLLTGARVSEVCGARVGNLGTDRGHRVLTVTRKGGKAQSLALPAPAMTRLEDYLATRPAALLPAAPGERGSSPFLFATATGGRMLRADVWRVVSRLARAAGLPPELAARTGPHAMRHAFATLSLDGGVAERDLQDAMGHADPRTTRRYDRARGLLDRAPGYTLAAYLAAGATAPPPPG